MQDIPKMLFNLQRFEILKLFATQGDDHLIEPAYAYAWDEGVYPIFDDRAPCHEPYQFTFQVSSEMANGLYDFLADVYEAQNTMSFYQLERHFDVTGSEAGPVWDRTSLICTCRYFHLHYRFDEAFWDALLKNTECPSEAFRVRREYTLSETSFQ